MAFDGITVACLVKELNDTILDGRINKIAQTDSHELLLTIKAPAANGKPIRLLLSADASLPLVYLTEETKPSPMNAPAFCMLLRKHLLNGRIAEITQPTLERVIRIKVQHLDEMGDPACKTLVIELMGKHSNIILVNDDDTVADAIKRIPSHVSSVREVLPGRAYFIPETMEKRSPLSLHAQEFYIAIRSKAMPVMKALYTSFTGISPVAAQEVCYRADVDSDLPGASLNDEQIQRLFTAFSSLTEQVTSGRFTPELIMLLDEPKEYAAFSLTHYHETEGVTRRAFDSVSALIRTFYAEKEAVTRIRQKSADLRRIVSGAIERNVKKLDLQMHQLEDTEKKDRYRLYGELLTAYAYQMKEGEREVTLTDYHTDREITIPLDETLTPSQNAAHYYARYNKLKRTAENLAVQTKQVREEIEHLRSVAASIDLSRTESDLIPIRKELYETGYLKSASKDKGRTRDTVSPPYHYITSDGFDVYVGRNNYQNDTLTKKAAGEDWWFHVKKEAGSHVILKTAGREVPDRAFEEAAALAAYYSGVRAHDKVEVDYVKRSEIKKPAGAKPGFVVYYTNYSMTISPKQALTLQQITER